MYLGEIRHLPENTQTPAVYAGDELVEIGHLSEIHQSAAGWSLSDIRQLARNRQTPPVYSGEEWFPYNVVIGREKTVEMPPRASPGAPREFYSNYAGA